MLDEVDNDLEGFRRDCLIGLQKEQGWLKKVAEETLGVKIVLVKPIGPVTQRFKFNPDSDVDVGFYLKPGASEIDYNLSEKLQKELVNHPVDPFGVANCTVYK